MTLIPPNVDHAISLIREVNDMFRDDLLLLKVNDDDQTLEVALQMHSYVLVARFDGEYFIDIQSVNDVEEARALDRLEGAK